MISPGVHNLISNLASLGEYNYDSQFFSLEIALIGRNEVLAGILLIMGGIDLGRLGRRFVVPRQQCQVYLVHLGLLDLGIDAKSFGTMYLLAILSQYKKLLGLFEEWLLRDSVFGIHLRR